MSPSASPAPEGGPAAEQRGVSPLGRGSSRPPPSPPRVERAQSPPARQSPGASTSTRPAHSTSPRPASPKHARSEMHGDGDAMEEREAKRQKTPLEAPGPSTAELAPSPQHVLPGREDDAEGELELDMDNATPRSGKTTERDRRDSTQDTPTTSRLGTPGAERKGERKKAAAPQPQPGKRARKPKSEESKEKDRLRKKQKRDEERAARVAAAGGEPVVPKRERVEEEANGPEEEGDEGDYCICKGKNDEDGGTMVGCEMCDNWYHPSCVGLDEAQVDMLDVYICSACEGKTGRKSVYRKVCKRDGCREAARTTSKFCSSQCAFSHSQSLLQGLEKKDVQELRALEAYPSPSPSVTVEHTDGSSDATPKQDSSSSTLLESLAAQAEKISQALEIVQKRQALLDQAVAAWEALAPSAPVADEPAPKKKSKMKRRDAPADTRPCGWDSRLLWDDEAVKAWDASAPALAEEQEGEDETAMSRAESAGLCTNGRRCERHAGWQKTTSVALDVEAAHLARRQAEVAQLTERIERLNESQAAGRTAHDNVHAALKAR